MVNERRGEIETRRKKEEGEGVEKARKWSRKGKKEEMERKEGRWK